MSDVIVLGAAASMGCGFPLGSGLRDEICGLPWSGRKDLFPQVGIDGLAEFVDVFRRTAYTSVDWFLEERPEFKIVGKHAIAAALVPHETEQALFPPNLNREHWYEDWVNALGHIVIKPRSMPRIITFNYDRSLEHYLFNILRHRYQLSKAKALRILKNYGVLHLHGTLGPYPERPYSPKLDPENLMAAAESIITVGEASDDSNPYVQARSALDAADRIVFLGFGFHPVSLQRLGFPRSVQIEATVFRIRPSDLESVQKSLGLASRVKIHNARVGMAVKQLGLIG